MSKRYGRNKGPRRSHLKRFSGEYVNAGKKANSASLSELFSHTRSLKTISMEDYGKYMTSTPEKSQVANADPLDVVYGKLKELWQTDFWQKEIRFNRINLIITPDRNLFLFFSNVGDHWFFVAEYPHRTTQNRDRRFTKKPDGLLDNAPRDSGFVKRSIVYPSKDFAMKAYQANRIHWIDKRALAQPLLDGVPPPKLHMTRIIISKPGS